jgi:hypothetical protein
MILVTQVEQANALNLLNQLLSRPSLATETSSDWNIVAGGEVIATIGASGKPVIKIGECTKSLSTQDKLKTEQWIKELESKARAQG